RRGAPRDEPDDWAGGAVLPGPDQVRRPGPPRQRADDFCAMAEGHSPDGLPGGPRAGEAVLAVGVTNPTSPKAGMRDGSDYLDPNRPDYVRLSVSEARALGEAALARIGYGEDDARIVTDQLIDNSLCGYRFAGLPRILAIAREAKTKNDR